MQTFNSVIELYKEWLIDLSVQPCEKSPDYSWSILYMLLFVQAFGFADWCYPDVTEIYRINI